MSFVRHVCMPRQDALEQLLNVVHWTIFCLLCFVYSLSILYQFLYFLHFGSKRKPSQELSRLQQDFEAPETKLTSVSSVCCAWVNIAGESMWRVFSCRVQTSSNLSNTVGTMWVCSNGHSKLIWNQFQTTSASTQATSLETEDFKKDMLPSLSAMKSPCKIAQSPFHGLKTKNGTFSVTTAWYEYREEQPDTSCEYESICRVLTQCTNKIVQQWQVGCFDQL